MGISEELGGDVEGVGGGPAGVASGVGVEGEVSAELGGGECGRSGCVVVDGLTFLGGQIRGSETITRVVGMICGMGSAMVRGGGPVAAEGGEREIVCETASAVPGLLAVRGEVVGECHGVAGDLVGDDLAVAEADEDAFLAEAAEEVVLVAGGGP